MIALHCADCGVEFYLQDDYVRRRKEDGKSFYCPAGHGNVYRPSENDKLKEQVTNLTNRLEHRTHQLNYWIKEYNEIKKELEARERSINGYKGYIGLLKSKHRKELNT